MKNDEGAHSAGHFARIPERAEQSSLPDDFWMCCFEDTSGPHAQWCPHFSAEARARFEVLGVYAADACNAVMPHTEPPGRFLCYRPDGHEGPHKSPLPDGGAAMWTDEWRRPPSVVHGPGCVPGSGCINDPTTGCHRA
jgi:hypothetical protein